MSHIVSQSARGFNTVQCTSYMSEREHVCARAQTVISTSASTSTSAQNQFATSLLIRSLLWICLSILMLFATSAQAQSTHTAIYYYYTSSGQLIAVVCYFYPGGGGYCTTDTGSVRSALAASGGGAPIGCGNCQPTDFQLSPRELLNLSTPLPLVNAGQSFGIQSQLSLGAGLQQNLQARTNLQHSTQLTQTLQVAPQVQVGVNMNVNIDQGMQQRGF